MCPACTQCQSRDVAVRFTALPCPCTACLCPGHHGGRHLLWDPLPASYEGCGTGPPAGVALRPGVLRGQCRGGGHGECQWGAARGWALGPVLCRSWLCWAEALARLVMVRRDCRQACLPRLGLRPLTAHAAGSWNYSLGLASTGDMQRCGVEPTSPAAASSPGPLLCLCLCVPTSQAAGESVGSVCPGRPALGLAPALALGGVRCEWIPRESGETGVGMCLERGGNVLEHDECVCRAVGVAMAQRGRWRPWPGTGGMCSVLVP